MGDRASGSERRGGGGGQVSTRGCVDGIRAWQERRKI
jgi:hypothetical protein